MATRPVYSATIKFDFDTKGLEKSVKNVQNIVKSAVQNIGKTTQDIEIDIPTGAIDPTEAFKGEINEMRDDLSRRIRGAVRSAFSNLDDEIDTDDISHALKRISEEFETLPDSILVIGKMSDMVDRITAEFRRMALETTESFRFMAKEMIDVSEQISAIDPEKLTPIVDVMQLKKASNTARETGEQSEKSLYGYEKVIIAIGDAITSTVKRGFTPLVRVLQIVNDATDNTAEATRFVEGQLRNFGGAVEDARKASVGFGRSGLATGAVLVFGENVKNAAGAVDNLKRSMKDHKEAATKAFTFKKSPVEMMGITGARKAIAELEETMTRLPDKTSASYKAIRREFTDVRAEVIKTLKASEKGPIEQWKLDEANESLKTVSKTIRDFKVTQLQNLREELDRNTEAVSLTRKNVVDRFRDIKDGITIASETGENKLLSLRVAMFGIGEATGPVSKLLDRFTSRLDDVGKAEGKLAELTSRTTKSLASQQQAVKSSVDILKRVAQAEGLHSAALNDVDAQVARVEKSYKDMTTTIEATGKATPQQLARVREEYRLLEESISLVKEENKDAIGPDTLKAFDAMEKRIRSNVPATRVLAATLDKAATKVDELKNSTEDANKKTSKSVGIFGRLKATLVNLLGVTSKQEDGTRALGAEMDIAAGIASRAGGAFLGAFGGTLVLGAIDRVKNALTSMSESTGSQIEKETKRIEAAFHLLPDEAEVVSATIADVYESNLGGSVEEVGEATQRAVARFRELGVTSEEEISGLLKDTFRISDVYKFDVPESLDAAAVLMKSFGLTTKKSTEFLAGLGKAGIVGSDALDSILEYSTQIQSAGGNAEDLFNIIRTGFAGGGTLGTDKAVDLFKEFRLQMSGGSEEVQNALNEIGINSTQLLADMSSGTISVTDAFDFVNQKLGELDSQTDITRLGSVVMGTQFEDMGNQMALAIRTTGTSMSDLAGSTTGLEATYTDLGSAMEAINRRMESSFSPLKDAFLALAMQAIPPILSGIELLRPKIEAIAGRVNMLIQAMSSGDWGTARDIVLSAFSQIAEGAVSILDWLIASGYDWGASFVIEIANGLIETASVVIVQAMEAIGNMMAGFLAPGSPPEKGPLSNIDKWGKGLVNELGIGFKAADFKFVEQATRPIEEHFKKTFGKKGFEAFKGVRDQFTEMVIEINKTGIIDEKKFKEIEKSIGGANTELTKMLKVQLKLKKAEQALARIQEEATEAQQAGFVSEGLKKKLKAAEEEVSTAKENVEWQKEFLKFQGLSEDKFKGIGGAAAKAAMTGTKAVKQAVDKQMQFINAGYEKEKSMLQAKFDAGIIAEDEYLKELIKLEEKYVDVSQEKGLMSTERLAAWGKKLGDLKGDLKSFQDTAKKAAKGIPNIGEALFGAPEDVEGAEGVTGAIGTNLLTGAKDIGISLGDNIADGLLESAKTRLGAAISSIGTKISTLFQEKILSKITPAQKEAGGMIGSALLGIGVSGMITKIGLIGSKIGALSGIALRFTYIGTAIWLVWKNWDKILPLINTAVETLTGLWEDFTDKLGGSEEAIAIFTGIFEDIKETLTTIGTNLKEFVLDALSGESITFSDFLGIFDFSNIDTEPIKDVVAAFKDVLQEQVDLITLDLLFVSDDEDAGLTRLGEIVANFQEKMGEIKTAFDEFMQEGRLGGALKNLANTISSAWLKLTIAMTPITAVLLPKLLPLISQIVPQLASIAPMIGRLVPIIAVATVVINNFGAIWPGIETALTGAVTAISGVILVIDGLLSLFDDETRQEGILKIQEGITDVFVGIADAVIGAGEAISQFFINATADIVGGLASIMEALGAEEAGKAFRELETFIDSVSLKVTELVADARALLLGLRNQLKVIFSLIGLDFWRALEAMKIFASSIGQQIWDTLVGWFQSLYDKLIGNSIVTDMIDGIITAFTNLRTWLSVSILLTISRVIGYFTTLKTRVETKITELKDSAVEAISGMITSVLESLGIESLDEALAPFTALKDGATEAISDMTTNIKSSFLGLKTKVSLTASIISTKVKDKIGTAAEKAAETTEEATSSIKDAYSTMSTFITTKAGVAAILVKSRFSTMSTFVTEKADALKTFATEASSFVSDLVTTAGELEFDTIDETISSIDTLVESITGFNLIDISTGIENITTSLTTFADDALVTVENFITDTVASFTGVDISEEIDAIFEPIHTALNFIAEFDISEVLSGLFSGFGETGRDIDMQAPDVNPITAAFETMKTNSIANLTEIGDAVTGLFSEDLAEDAATFAIGVATPIANLSVTIGDSMTTSRDELTGMFADLDLSGDAATLVIGAATPIYLLTTTIGDAATEVYDSVSGMFDGIDLETTVSDIATTVTTGIETMVTDGLDAVSGFATDFVNYILDIPIKIKEKISDFTDVGSLLADAFGFGEDEDITGEVAKEFKGAESDIVAPVESTTEKIKGAWNDAYDWVVGNSVVPDLVTGVTEQFNLMSLSVTPSVMLLTSSIKSAFTTMSYMVTQAVTLMNLSIRMDIYNTNLMISNDYMIMTQAVSSHVMIMNNNIATVLGTIRPTWVSDFTAMTTTTRVFGDIGRQVLIMIDRLVRKLTDSVKKFKASLDAAKISLDDLRETDLGDMNDAFKRMYSLVKKTRDEAKKFAKFMEKARDAARDIGDTLGGNVPGGGGAPGAQHGAWSVPRDQLMFIHRREAILPADVASSFRNLMISLNQAGIGTQGFDIPVATTQPPATNGAAGPTIVNIRNDFPNVTSAREADTIADKLNTMIDNARKFSAVGGQS